MENISDFTTENHKVSSKAHHYCQSDRYGSIFNSLFFNLPEKCKKGEIRAFIFFLHKRVSTPRVARR